MALTHYAHELREIKIRGRMVSDGPTYRIACGATEGEAVTKGPGINLRRDVDCPACLVIIKAEKPAR